MTEPAVLATIGAVYGDGVSLIFDGQAKASTKHYKINTSVPFKAGDRVKITKDSGTYIAEYVVGPQYTGSSSGGGTVAGVTSWNGRTGAVVPQAGDYNIPGAGTATPKAPTAAGAVGVSERYAREDHAHPRQTLNVSDLDTVALYRAMKEQIFADLYPLDSYYFSDDATYPGTLFGGDWRQVETSGPSAYAWRRTDGTNNDRISSVAGRAVAGIAIAGREWLRQEENHV